VLTIRIVLLGAPGSGKGTQAKKLTETRHVPHISTGDMLREAVAAGTRFGQKAKSIMDAGELVPDDVMLGIISERLTQPDAREGFILDGFPRTVAQARALDGLLSDLGVRLERCVSLTAREDLEELLDELEAPLDAAILFAVDTDVLMKRLTGRRTCSKTGKLLNIYYSPQEEIDACIDAGGELVQRDDDNEETITNRLKVYRENTEPVIDYYRRRDKLEVVDAEGTIDEVHERLLDVLGRPSDQISASISLPQPSRRPP